MTRIAGLGGPAALTALFLVAWTGTAQADFTQEVQRCDSGSEHPDIRIVACTRNIKSGRFIGRNLAVAFSNRGLAYKMKGHGDKAIADFSEAIRLKPDFVFALNNRGNAYYDKGHFDRAIEDYDEAVRLKPDFAEAFSNRGNVYRKKGLIERAIEDYDKAIGLNPDDARVFAERGLAYEKKGEGDQALRDYKKAFALGFFHPLLLKKLNQSGTLP
ncbi:MAG: tetratricopeptide repeat protein [Proteobacteria bacterium]|nr:tetratricopeptide repeat protein [Pseudomonadota bacterium]